MKVMILDPDKGLAAIITAAVRAHGHEVHTVHSMSLAEEFARENEVDFAMIDVSASSNGNVDFIGRLKKTKPETRVAAMTGDDYYNPDLEAVLRRHGVLYYTIRPTESIPLLKSVVDHLFVRLDLMRRPGNGARPPH